MREPVDGLAGSISINAALLDLDIAARRGPGRHLWLRRRRPPLSVAIRSLSSFSRIQQAGPNLDYRSAGDNFTLALASSITRLRRRALVILSTFRRYDDRRTLDRKPAACRQPSMWFVS